MDIIIIIGGLMGLLYLALLVVGFSFDEKFRVLEDQIKYMIARKHDIRDMLCSRIHRDKNRKLGYEALSHWMSEEHALENKMEYFLGQVGGWKSLFMSVKMIWGVGKLVSDLEILNRKSDVLVRNLLPDARTLCRSSYIPVKPVVGQVASTTLKQLELLLQDDKVGGIIIHGVEGVGKTFLMKHLHNSALRCVKKFDNVIWVTIPNQFTIKYVQDVIASLIKCDLTSDDELSVRARKLSDKLAGIGSCVLFLDGVLGKDFSLDQVGIDPVPVEGSKFKLVLTTRFTFGSSALDHFVAVKVDPLPKDEAYELFIKEANLGKVSLSSLGRSPSLLVNRCGGVPRMIVDLATKMCGIDDHHEWRNALYELGFRGCKTNFHLRL
ncbi:unnamed protein product [Amaranthus hypochondriacus]